MEQRGLVTTQSELYLFEQLRRSQTASINITRERGPTCGRDVTMVKGHEAEMTYSRASASRIFIDHTNVPSALAGLGAWKALDLCTGEDARREGFKIIPLCASAKAMINKNPAWQEVLQ